jgi:hypothetical protein
MCVINTFCEIRVLVRRQMKEECKYYACSFNFFFITLEPEVE